MKPRAPLSPEDKTVEVFRGFQVEMCTTRLDHAARHARDNDWPAAREALREALGLAKSLGWEELTGTILTALRHTKRVVS